MCIRDRAKASLESSVRYLADAVGSKGIRVNGLSAGAVKTLAASGIKDFGKLLGISAAASPLKRNVTIDEVGNVAAFLLSDLASGMTGQISYVDCGVSPVSYTHLDVYKRQSIRCRQPFRASPDRCRCR